jgi:hypothetical protein
MTRASLYKPSERNQARIYTAFFGLAGGKATTDCTDYTDLDTKKDNTKIKIDVAGRKILLPQRSPRAQRFLNSKVKK